MLPGSLVRSRTAIARVLFGNAERNASESNGRKSRTFRNPTFSPVCKRYSTVSSTAPAAGAHHHDDALGDRARPRNRTGDSCGRFERRNGSSRSARSWGRHGKTGCTPRAPGKIRPGSAPCPAERDGRAKARARDGGGQRRLVDQRAQVLILERNNLVDFVGGAEAIEKMQERDARFKRSGLRDEGEIGSFLDRIGSRAARTRSGAWPSRRCDRQKSIVRGWRRCAPRRESPPRVSSPAILYMFGIISSRPCEAVKVVPSAPACSAPCSAPAAPPSLCISMTVGNAPDVLAALLFPLVRPFAHRRRRRNGIDGNHLVQPVGYRGNGFISVENHLTLVHFLFALPERVAGFPTQSTTGGAASMETSALKRMIFSRSRGPSVCMEDFSSMFRSNRNAKTGM